MSDATCGRHHGSGPKHPDGHPKLRHLWPPKLPPAARHLVQNRTRLKPVQKRPRVAFSKLAFVPIFKRQIGFSRENQPRQGRLVGLARPGQGDDGKALGRALQGVSGDAENHFVQIRTLTFDWQS